MDDGNEENHKCLTSWTNSSDHLKEIFAPSSSLWKRPRPFTYRRSTSRARQPKTLSKAANHGRSCPRVLAVRASNSLRPRHQLLRHAYSKLKGNRTAEVNISVADVDEDVPDDEKEQVDEGLTYGSCFKHLFADVNCDEGNKVDNPSSRLHQALLKPFAPIVWIQSATPALYSWDGRHVTPCTGLLLAVRGTRLFGRHANAEELGVGH
ncbi:hypothetical protein EDD37DRAFT_643783 [Exophiala viscosa]|uniref:uncharacterized protein n=1 Tax=Exophiala viscosa TaxID=2486360 RepID=UPI002195C8EF|nr:hypothetical protein EDD37DRAFT_643783 [Exophiala viscosa]